MSAPEVSAPWGLNVARILGGDQAVVFAHVTPASGVVLTPLTNFGIVDRDGGTLTPLSSSVGMWRKLRHIQENPHVAVAYHAREHGFTSGPEYVLVQGTASYSAPQDPAWLDRHRESWERFAGPRDVGPLWERWLRIYHWRVGIQVKVQRVLVWPELSCHGPAQVYGAPLPDTPAPAQRAPDGGMAPRIDHVRAARHAARLPHLLLGWVDIDGLPIVLPVQVADTEPSGIRLNVPDGVIPAGGRRAGLLAHSFARYAYGQRQRKHTGWLQAEADRTRVVYAPHTEHGYHLPRSRTLYRLSAGLATRRGYREGIRDGFLTG